MVVKIYELKIKTGFNNEPSYGAMLSSHRSSPSATKTEHFRTEAARAFRRKEIEGAVTTINLVPWLVCLENSEIDIKE